jgi:hypothetical protein
MPRPETCGSAIRDFLLSHPGQGFTIPEICKALDLDPWSTHASVRRILLALGYSIVAQEGLREHELKGRGGRRKPVNIWSKT